MIRKALLTVAAIGLIATSPASAHLAPLPVRVMHDHHRIVALQSEVRSLEDQISRAGIVLKHAWPSLTHDEKTALTAVLKTLPKSTKFDIICNTASCDDLAEDIDDCLERAGLSSGLDHSAGPLGYGVGIMVNAFDQKTAEKAIAALGKTTGGHLVPTLIIAKPGENPPGYVSVLIGKHPEK